jgi:hypothetical protein
MDDEFYTQGNKQYERVTRVINYFCPPELVDYRIRVGNRVANAAMKKAGKFGTMIDEAIRENYEMPTVQKVSEESKSALKAWISWVNDHGANFLVFPDTYFSDFLLVAGTPDFIWKNMIVDIKTSNRISPIYFAQLGAYASLRPALFGGEKPTEDLAVLRLDKSTGLYEFVKASEMGLSVGDCINWFNALLITYRNYKQVQSTLKGKEVCNGRDNDSW